jgi:hypothetical protein
VDGASLEAFVKAPCRPIQWLGRKGVELEQAARETVSNSAGPTRCPARTSALGKPGSTSGLPFEAEDVRELLESKAVRQRAAYLYAMHVAPARGRLTREDFAQAWALLEMLPPNGDGSMPSARLKALWNRLYEQGAFGRAWDDSRWSAVWKTLADCGFLAVESTDYWHVEGGKGRAMRWRLDPAYSLADPAPEGGREHLGRKLSPPPEYRPGVYRPCLVSPPGPRHVDLTAEELQALVWPGG